MLKGEELSILRERVIYLIMALLSVGGQKRQVILLILGMFFWFAKGLAMGKQFFVMLIKRI